MAKEKEKDPKGNEEEVEKKEGEEQAEGEGAEAAPKKSKLSKKMLIIIGAGGFLLLGSCVGATLFFVGVFDKKPVAEAEGHGAEAAKKAPEKEGKISFFPLGDLLVNLSGEGKRPNFLKVKISLELADEKDAAVLEALKPRIIDNFQVYLRELRIEDLRGSAGMYRLREALLLRVTEVATPVRIRDVLFQEMLVQ